MRVSSDSADQLNSFTAQVHYYTNYIQCHPDWTFVDIYADEGLSGTSADKREEFLRLMRDCRQGKIDRVLTKSVSRFARNVQDCIEAVRELRQLKVSVCFEKERLDTALMTNEMLLSRGKFNTKKSDCHIHATLQQRLDAVYRLRFQHDIKTLCRVLNVSRSTYYKHFFSEPAPRTVQNQQIKVSILEIYSSFDKSIGAYKIRHVLERDYGISISVRRVYRLMKTMNLPKMSTNKPKYKPSRNDNGPCVNHLKQNFHQQAPNLAWASDFTYVKVNGQYNYLCVVLDLFSRRVIGWHTASRHNANLTMAAFKKAYESRGRPQNVLFHSDRGCEYTCYQFRQLMDECNCLQSFSKKGYPYDNACLESFFKQMKREELNRRTFHSLEDFRLSCFQYIERYNNRRPHSSLGNLTPVEVENNYWAR